MTLSADRTKANANHYHEIAEQWLAEVNRCLAEAKTAPTAWDRSLKLMCASRACENAAHFEYKAAVILLEGRGASKDN